MAWSLSCIFVLLSVCCLGLAAMTAKEHVEIANKQLAAGEYTSAMDHYDAACDMEPNNYMLAFRRATTYLAMGKSRHAIRDLDKVIKLKPDFTQARQKRSELLLKNGKFAAAIEDLKELGDAEGQQQALQAEQAVQQGLAFAEQGEHAHAIVLLSQAIEVASNYEEIRMARGKAYQATGQLGQAIGDITRAAKMKSDNTAAYWLLSELHYQTGDRQEALNQIRECLKLDADHKGCFAFYKKVKKFNKAADKVVDTMNKNRYAEAMRNLIKARDVENEENYYVQEMLGWECTCLTNMNKPAEALAVCSKVLESSPEDVTALKNRAKIHEQLEDYEACVKDWQEAASVDGENREIKQGLNRAQKLLKNSKKRDYYKILGVPRNAKKRQITKAYRDMALKWHPDKFEGEEDKKMAEKKFMDIAAAKEVLTDPEKRQMFDNGEDPLDAEQERERNSQPFRGGFNPFGQGFGGGHGGGGGGGQRFHFKYN